jgi:fibronectin-binding autotransporter adhesin
MQRRSGAFWLTGYGAWMSTAASGGGLAVRATLGGGAIGADYRLAPDALIGLTIGYGSTNSTMSATGDNARQSLYQFATYGGMTFGRLYVDGLVGAGFAEGTMTRDLSVPGLAASAKGSQHGPLVFGAIETGARYELPAGFGITPFAGLDASSVRQDAFSETSVSPLALSVATQSTTSIRSHLGVRLSNDMTVGTVPVFAEVSIAWAHEFADVARPVTAGFTAVPTASFTVHGAPAARDQAQVGVTALVRLSEAARLFMRYDGSYGGGQIVNAARGGLRITW